MASLGEEANPPRFWFDDMETKDPDHASPRVSDAQPLACDDTTIIKVADYPRGHQILNQTFFQTDGLGTPGSPLYLDIGATPGDPFLLAGALGPGSTPLGYGTLLLDPASTQCLLAGTIPAAKSVATLSASFSAQYAAGTPLNLHFQALVLNGSGPGGQLTNATKFTVPATTAAATWSDPSPSPALAPLAGPPRVPWPPSRAQLLRSVVVTVPLR